MQWPDITSAKKLFPSLDESETGIPSFSISQPAWQILQPNGDNCLKAQLMVLLCRAFGRSEIIEKIFENRFMHASELNRMGAKIKIFGNRAIVEGNVNFKAAELMATDLRASVSLILAALVAKGKSIINRVYHLDRGYESIEQKLRNAGASIRRIS